MLETIAQPILYPSIPMGRFGLIDEAYGGGPKYRLIWAPSRMVTLTGRYKTMTVPYYVNTYDQDTGQLVYPAIEPVGENWILEMWKGPWDLYRGTKDDWEADQQMLNMGPYPSKGDYLMSEVINGSPSDANIEKLIHWIEEGGKRRQIENTVFCRDQMEKGMLDRQKQRKDLLDSSQRPWGAESYAAAGGGRNSKTYAQLKSREELGLPAQGVTKAIRPKKREIFEVMTEA